MKEIRGLFLLVCFSQSLAQGLQGIRLVGSSYGNHTGRVEVLYNDTWGAVCGQNRYNSASTVCRQLGFPRATCTLPYSNSEPPQFGALPENATVWMSNLLCSGNEKSLNACTFDGYAGATCTNGPVQVVCQSYDVVGPPLNVTQTDSSSTTVTVEWMISNVPAYAERIRHRIFVNEAVSNRLVKNFLLRTRQYSPVASTRFSAVIHTLNKNSTYKVYIVTQIKYLCQGSGGYTSSRRSSVLQATTAEQRKVSMLPIRLVPPAPDVDFMGLVEVFYNDTWGTVCDDQFASLEANVICRSLNFSRSLCHVREAGFGQGEGPIWMDNVDCSRGHEVLEDCDFNGWGVHNCGHDADIGVICVPVDHLSPVEGVVIDQIGATSISASWDAFSFPLLSTNPRYTVLYATGRGRLSRVSVPGTETTATLTGLVTDRTYTIRVRAEFSYSYCRQSVTGNLSEVVRATTRETAPTAPPTAFHVLVLNSTTLEFQWGLPLYEHRNGIIEGYRLFIMTAGQDEQEIVVSNAAATEYIVGGLTPSTVYTCSILAFTNSNGPRSVYLTVITPDEGFVSIISGFGLNGDGYDRVTVWPNQSDIRIHCDATNGDFTVTWYRNDGTPVGTRDRNSRQVSYNNGTTVLQIASSRQLSYCDAGVYTCVVNNSQGDTQKRDFSLMFTDVPPRPSSPYPLRVTSSAMTIAWDELSCDGGHIVSGFTIRYRKTYQEYLTMTNMYVYNVNPSSRNYTIVDLEPYTSYNFSVQAISAEFRPSEFSLENIITTRTEAPTPPRFVNARVVAPLTVEVQWTEPAEANGLITAYTVYVNEISLGDIAADNPPPITNVVSGSTGSVNITVPKASVSYLFTVSATVLIADDKIESDASLAELVYVPDPTIPSVDKVRVKDFSNSSISLQWDYPSSSDVPILGFQVSYTANIEWRSKEGYLVKFTESDEEEFPYNTALLTALTPHTQYKIRVSVVSEIGVGPPSKDITVATWPASEDTLAYFQLMVGPIGSCIQWQSDSVNSLQKIHSALLSEINTNLCPLCGFTDKNVREEELSCRGAETDQQIVYRARIVGNDKNSAVHMVLVLGDWVKTDTASLLVDSQRLHIDALCETSLDRPSAPDCTIVEPTTSIAPITTTTTVSTTDKLPSTAPQVLVDLSGGQIGGIVLGVIIALLLLVFIVLLVVLIIIRCSSDFSTKRMAEEDTIDLTDSTDGLPNPVYDLGVESKNDSKTD